jgi:hypothetical protein
MGKPWESQENAMENHGNAKRKPKENTGVSRVRDNNKMTKRLLRTRA